MGDEYCTCNGRTSIYTENDDWGFWDVCCNCNKPVECSYTYFNHYDGEDHCDYDD
ncbi:hypothetical protein [Clostridium diolis]|uniref:hypothetical protein n=1 Tax=Clostridium diolis TaxID=223919 RepID=UPI003AF47973